jgi:hypothetical protein
MAEKGSKPDMVKALHIVLWVFFIMPAIACNEGMYELLNRTTDDPFVEMPGVESFVESNSITVHWTADEGADEYLLERASDAMMLNFVTVYEGADLSYRDSGLADGARFLYRLSKRRGTKVFGPWGPVLGVSALICRDDHEVNDAIDKATALGTVNVISNIYYYRAYNLTEVFDIDWYYIDVPALRKISIMINDEGISADDALTATHFRYYEHGRSGGVVLDLGPIYMYNYEASPQRFYLRIYPDESKYVDVAGGSIVRYTIVLGHIETL